MLFLPVIIIIAAVLAACMVVYRVYRRQTREYEITPRLDFIGTERLGSYYTALKQKIPFDFPKTEKGGYMTRNPATGDWFFNPVTTAHAAHAHYEVYLETGDGAQRAEFLRLAEALLAHAMKRPDGALVLEYDARYCGNQSGSWLSAMAQGHAIMVWLRAYEETGQDRWAESARRAAVPFTEHVWQGGVRCEDRWGVFYEEYAFSEPGRQRHTLNGMLSSLMGLYDLWKVTREEQYRALFETGVATIRRCLTLYEFPFCTAYDLRHLQGELPLMQSHYHCVHVAHLKILHAMTGDEYFRDVAARWRKTLASPYNRWCLFVHYLIWKTADFRNDARLAGGFLRALGSNLRRISRLFCKNC